MGLDRRDEPGTAVRPGARAFGVEKARENDKDKERQRVRWHDGVVSPARPLLRPAPWSAMFFPLVVIVAVLPGLYALNSWDLTPPGPWWGLRGLAVLDGVRVRPGPGGIGDHAGAGGLGVPLGGEPAAALCLARGGRAGARAPTATRWRRVLPSYVAGAVVVVLVYLHGRLWRGPGVGLVAAVLTGFNRNLLLQMQQATPTTLALAGTLGALLCYGWHLRMTSESSATRGPGAGRSSGRSWGACRWASR